VVNPRGLRPGSLRNDSFFQAIPRVLERVPQAFFVCPGMAGEAESERWVIRLDIGVRTRLWPRLTQSQLWTLFHRSRVYVSPSLHDGVPNSLLESMACGCFPVAGEVESLREWVRPGVNGLLVDAGRPVALAEAMITALSDGGLCQRAAQENARLIAERAEYGRCMAQADAFYQQLI
jgi:glycosyltransferase involved in cell wall biosynthesis